MGEVADRDRREAEGFLSEVSGPPIHRGFFRAAVIAMFTAGGVLGAILLALHAWRQDLTLLDYRAAIWAHAHVQIAGWTALFVMGFAYQAFPRFWGVAPSRPRAAAATLWAMAAGILLKFFAGLADHTAVGQIVGGVGGAIELAAVVVFLGVLVGSRRAAARPIAPWEKFVFAAGAWMAAAFAFDAWVFAASGRVRGDQAWIEFIALYDAPWRDLQLMGFAGGMILGVSLRLLPALYGSRRVSAPVANTLFWIWNLAIVVEIAAYVGFIQSYRIGWGLVWAAAVAALLGCFVAASFGAGLWRPAARPGRGLAFIRAAYVWGAVALAMLWLTPFYSRLVGQSFSHAWFGAFRHAWTVGFISLMIVGVSSAAVGASRARWSGLGAAFALINAGCALRVVFQVLTDFGPAAFPPTALSAPVELAGFALWAVELFRAMRERDGRVVKPAPSFGVRESSAVRA